MATGWAVHPDLTADPAAAAAGWERFWAIAPIFVRTAVAADAGLAQALAILFAGSEFLTGALLQSPEWAVWLAEERHRPSRVREEWAANLAAFTASLAPQDRTRGLMRFKQREYLRIALRDLEGRAGLAETTQELSDLADAILQQAYVWSWNEWVGQFGTPQSGSGSGAALVVIALGKLGGGELNYSSDIDLMFAYSDDGRTGGAGVSLSNAEFFARVAQSIVRYVSEMTGEGPAYRVDLRLRPGGREGELAQPLSHMERYYRTEAREWELQALLRARGCAGAQPLAKQLLAAVGEQVYPKTADGGRIAAGVRASREAIGAQLRLQRATGRRRPAADVKLDRGGIRDIEFLTQYWQRLHGGHHAWVRSGNTLLALQRLHDAKCIRSGEMQTLAGAYTLLRHTEHRVQLRLGQQTHTLPSRPERLRALARSLHALGLGGDDWDQDPRPAIAARMEAAAELYAHYLEGKSAAAVPRASAANLEWPAEIVWTEAGRRQAERFARSLASRPEDARVWGEDARAWEETTHAVRMRVATAFEISDWMAEALIRQPALARALGAGAEPPPEPSGELARDMNRLRHWQQGACLRLLVEEWETRAPIEASLLEQTRLAEATLAAALSVARAAAAASGREEAGSLAILGLGRLGLRELDLASDVDVVFAASEREREAATHLAAHWIELLTAYTQAGTLYAVDARLRPGGREGELVQTPAGLRQYFAGRAGA
ncbi:MAG: hypothetical protein ACRD1Y_03905, partial [Terriglobales bacterium]